MIDEDEEDHLKTPTRTDTKVDESTKQSQNDVSFKSARKRLDMSASKEEEEE